jgi:lipoate-protein ligase A
MLSHFYFYRADGLCPWHNLAIEEHIVTTLPQHTCVMYLYQHEKTVVIGKNQNAWKECRHTLLEEEGGKLARRISGGGAVYHDLGNLNFSFIVDKDDYDLHRQLGVILDAVRTLGIDAEFSGRNDILSEGAKFSGNAFCYKKTSAFHHGTILVDADMTKLSRYLSVSKDKISSKGVESVRSRVCNLRDRRPDLTVEMVVDALHHSFAKEYGAYLPLQIDDMSPIAEIEERNASWQWRLGSSPAFDIETGARFDWGCAEMCFSLKHGIVTDAHVYSDAMDAAFIEQIPSVFIGAAFQSDDLAGRLLAMGGTSEQKKIAQDMADFLIQKGY